MSVQASEVDSLAEPFVNADVSGGNAGDSEDDEGALSEEASGRNSPVAGASTGTFSVPTSSHNTENPHTRDGENAIFSAPPKVDQNGANNGHHADLPPPYFERPPFSHDHRFSDRMQQFALPQQLVTEIDDTENRLTEIRNMGNNLINQLAGIFYQMREFERYDIDELSDLFTQLIALKNALYDIHVDYDRMFEQVRVETINLLERYEKDANEQGGPLHEAKIDKIAVIRDHLNSWYECDKIENLPIFTDYENENEEDISQYYYDQCHKYQRLSRKPLNAPGTYRYQADIPAAALPTNFYVPPTAHLPPITYQPEEPIMPVVQMEPMDQGLPPMGVPPPIENMETDPIPDLMPQQMPVFNPVEMHNPPVSLSSNILPPMNMPPPVINTDSGAIGFPPPEFQGPGFVNGPPPPLAGPPTSSEAVMSMPMSSQSGMLPSGPSFTNSPIFSQPPPDFNVSSAMMPPKDVSGFDNPPPANIPINVGPANSQAGAFPPDGPPPTSGAQVYRNPPALMNLSIPTAMSNSSQPSNSTTTSTRIPSLLSIEVPFPIEILKRNQAQGQGAGPNAAANPGTTSNPNSTTRSSRGSARRSPGSDGKDSGGEVVSEQSPSEAGNSSPWTEPVPETEATGN